jgi:hypothetical protein
MITGVNVPTTHTMTWSMSMRSPTCRDATKLEPTHAAEAYETCLGTVPETCVDDGTDPPMSAWAHRSMTGGRNRKI